jgi:hypothetical protein
MCRAGQARQNIFVKERISLASTTTACTCSRQDLVLLINGRGHMIPSRVSMHINSRSGFISESHWCIKIIAGRRLHPKRNSLLSIGTCTTVVWKSIILIAVPERSNSTRFGSQCKNRLFNLVQPSKDILEILISLSFFFRLKWAAFIQFRLHEPISSEHNQEKSLTKTNYIYSCCPPSLKYALLHYLIIARDISQRPQTHREEF